MFKKHVKLIFLLIMVLLFGVIIYVTINKDDGKIPVAKTPKEAIENYFKYYNERNGRKLLYTLVEEKRNQKWNWEFYNLKSIKLVTIKEDENRLKSFPEIVSSISSPNNVKCYDVSFKMNYLIDQLGSMPSGSHTWTFFVTRKDDNSTWLIYDWES